MSLEFDESLLPENKQDRARAESRVRKAFAHFASSFSASAEEQRLGETLLGTLVDAFAPYRDSPPDMVCSALVRLAAGAQEDEAAFLRQVEEEGILVDEYRHLRWEAAAPGAAAEEQSRFGIPPLSDLVKDEEEVYALRNAVPALKYIVLTATLIDARAALGQLTDVKSPLTTADSYKRIRLGEKILESCGEAAPRISQRIGHVLAEADRKMAQALSGHKASEPKPVI